MHSYNERRERRKENVTHQLEAASKIIYIVFLFGTASKKTKLINNNNKLPQQHHQSDEQAGTNTAGGRYNGKVHQQHQTRANTLNSPVDAEQYANQDQESLYNGSNDLRGPRLVNKQLVLPAIITFPNAVSNDSNHLIKPSEYLKSISTDKRMITGNRR